GITRPRENTTPSSAGGAFGTVVTSSTISICWIKWLRSAYVVPASSNTTKVSGRFSVSVISLASSSARARRAGLRLAARSTETRNGRCVEDQNYSPVAELRRTGNPGDLKQRIADGSNNDFALAKDAVYCNGDQIQSGSDDKRMEMMPPHFIHPEYSSEAQEGQY